MWRFFSSTSIATCSRHNFVRSSLNRLGVGVVCRVVDSYIFLGRCSGTSLILSIAILRKRYNLTQYLSVLAVLGGLLIVTFTYIAETGEDENGNATENDDHVVLGIGLVVFGQLFNSLHCIF